MSAPA